MVVEVSLDVSVAAARSVNGTNASRFDLENLILKHQGRTTFNLINATL